MKNLMHCLVFAMIMAPFHLYADASGFIKAATKGDVKALIEELKKGIDVIRIPTDSLHFTALRHTGIPKR